MARESFEVPVVPATRDNTKNYGVFIGTDVPAAGLRIPFYQGAVEEGHNLPFVIPRCDNLEALRALEGSGIIRPPVGEELLGTYLRYLWSVGFMPLSTGQPVGAIHAAP